MRDNKIREIMVATVAKRRAEIERLRADNERLHNEDTKTRHALKGWVYVPPDGGAEPTHERVAAVVAEVERLREALEVEGLRLAACDVVAMADTPESAGRARQMQSDFRSAALSSVERRVDEVIALRAEIERLRADLATQQGCCDGAAAQDAHIRREREEMQSAKADAWDEGYQDHKEMIDGIARKPSNPYR